MRFLLLGLTLLIGVFANASFATAKTAQKTIEAIAIVGTERLSAETLKSAIRLKEGDPIDDESMQEFRARILGLGLFRDAIFSMQKGSDKDKAKLTIALKDDNSVAGDEALGAEFGLLAVDRPGSVGETSPFRSYHLGLIARNLFAGRHRAAFSGDMDVKGTLAAGMAAYGLPRFALEAVQFDAVLVATDPAYRYLETKGFGLKIQSQWTRSFKYGDLLYGAGWYANTHKRYRLEPWPEVVAGPRIGFVHDTRFLGFMPSEGWRASVNAMPSLVRRDEFISEAQLGGTWIPHRHIALSADLQSLTVGRSGFTSRGELRLDAPITDSRDQGTKAVLFSSLRQGYDHYENVSISGSDATLGIRYFSTAFIGELSFQFTQNNPFKDASSTPPKANPKDQGT